MTQRPSLTTILLMSDDSKANIKSINSAITQRGNFDHKFLVCSECSDNKSLQTIKNYLANLPDNIKCNLLEINPVNNLFDCIDIAQSQYAHIIHSPDYILNPEMLWKQTGFMENNQQCHMCFSNALYIDSRTQGRIAPPILIKLSPSSNDNQNYISPFLTSTCLFRTIILQQMDNYAKYNLFGDSLVNIWFSNLYSIGYIPGEDLVKIIK